MNTLSLIAALLLGAFAAQPAHRSPPSAGTDYTLFRAERARPVGPLAGVASATAWEVSYNAEATGKLDVALSSLASLPSAERNGYLASFRRGWLLYRLGRYPDSVAEYKTAVGLEPAAVEARVALLLPLMALTKWNDTAQVAQSVLKIDPENYLALQRLALAEFSTQHFGEAETHYRRILALYPSDIEMRTALGWTLLRMGKQAPAVAAFNQVLQVVSTHVSATRGLQEARGQKADR
jgi:tetratricopeptide (TPR) repeat protein